MRVSPFIGVSFVKAKACKACLIAAVCIVIVTSHWQYRLGLFDAASAQPYLNVSASVVCNEAHTELALSAARQGIVLLKNNGSVLPLSAATIKTLAVIGPNGIGHLPLATVVSLLCPQAEQLRSAALMNLALPAMWYMCLCLGCVGTPS
jgi:hypothetical protein